jgi:hypothetical protein
VQYLVGAVKLPNVARNGHLPVVQYLIGLGRIQNLRSDHNKIIWNKIPWTTVYTRGNQDSWVTSSHLRVLVTPSIHSPK